MGETDPRKMGVKGIRNHKAREQRGRCFCCGVSLAPQQGKPNSVSAFRLDPFALEDVALFDNLVASCHACLQARQTIYRLGYAIELDDFLAIAKANRLNSFIASMKGEPEKPNPWISVNRAISLARKIQARSAAAGERWPDYELVYVAKPPDEKNQRAVHIGYWWNDGEFYRIATIGFDGDGKVAFAVDRRDRFVHLWEKDMAAPARVSS